MTSAPVVVDGTGAGLDAAAQIEDQLIAATKQRGRRLGDYVGPLLVFVLFIVLWEYMHRDGIQRWLGRKPSVLPSPVTIIDQSLFNKIFRDQLITGLGWTCLVAFVGLGITIVIGMALAIVMAQKAWVERSLYPYLVALQATPVLAIVPIIYTVFGGGLGARIYVCIMIAIFPIVTNTLFGLTSADASQHDLFTLRHASTWTRMRKLQFPNAMPAIFTGFRISAGLSVVGAVVGEQFFREGAKPGLGVAIDQFRTRLQRPPMYGAIIVACLLGIVVFFVFGLLSRLVVGHWYESQRS